jgi:hypothetical protein
MLSRQMHQKAQRWEAQVRLRVIGHRSRPWRAPDAEHLLFVHPFSENGTRRSWGVAT